MHTMTPVSAKVHGDRALVESRGQILIRPRVNDVEVDVTSWCRFFSRAERRDGEWRLLTFDSTEHTAYTKSPCIDGAVNAYLLRGTLPPEGKVCKA